MKVKTRLTVNSIIYHHHHHHHHSVHLSYVIFADKEHKNEQSDAGRNRKAIAEYVFQQTKRYKNY